MNYRARQDNLLLAEMYELVLETPATEANIQRFINKYLKFAIIPPVAARDISVDLLNDWTPRVQQVIKAAGGNPDIFAYPSLPALQQAIADSRTSKTNVKKAYKNAQIKNLPILADTNEYIICQPLTWEVSRKYFGIDRESLMNGDHKEGASWCTSSSSPNFFNQYVKTNKDRLLYFIRKRDDELFAARCINTQHEYKYPDHVYDAWYTQKNTSCNVVSARQAVQQFKGALKEPAHVKAIAQNYFVQHSLDCLAPVYVKECRNQKNEEIAMITLYQSLMDINLFDPRIADRIPDITEDYIKFVAFVVFGKTI